MDWMDLPAVPGTLNSLLTTPQFKSINYLVLSVLYSPPLTSIHDHWYVYLVRAKGELSGSPGGSVVKNPLAIAEDMGLIPG